MISRNNTYCLETINSVIAANRNKYIKIFFSIQENIYLNIKNQINQSTNIINIITYKDKYKSVFDHIKFLINHCTSEYIMIIHDDDIIGKDFFINVYQNLEKLNPEALSSRVTFIDSESNEIKRKRLKSINKNYKLNTRDILNRYFLPFKQGTTIFPTICFKTNIYRNYWVQNKKFIGLHEDVKIVYYFSSRGNFYENGTTKNFFYRLHNNQISANKVSKDRKSLNRWLIEIEENKIYKFLLIIFAKLQYFIYYKDIKLKDKRLNKLLNIIRDQIHNYRSGFD
tara:strand:+ start:17672 stop:18520 length:849 start_codon:yes stop_codon:yes gene_type:complete